MLALESDERPVETVATLVGEVRMLAEAVVALVLRSNFDVLLESEVLAIFVGRSASKTEGAGDERSTFSSAGASGISCPATRPDQWRR